MSNDQVDSNPGVVMGISVEAGVLFGQHVVVGIRETLGAAGTDLYVSFVFVVVLGIVGGLVLRDGIREKRGERTQREILRRVGGQGSLDRCLPKVSSAEPGGFPLERPGPGMLRLPDAAHLKRPEPP